ncbi:hypothetical protein [Microbulbifer sp.]|uniref:hypothetical protein n=1 Tax=Microbulbifer sp. TaxID=1908541 RepID=UPI003F3114B6
MDKLIVVILVLSLGACVKLEVKPQELVKDTVSTTKDAYDNYKLKKKGYVERNFEHSVQLEVDKDETDAALKCLDIVRKLAQESSDKKIKIISQSTKVSGENGNRRMQCKIKAFI